ncbi:hypothetical protein [Cypionkella sp.]|uniref:hypothetical protein n=1 Tax=Cypionkella sp. TaxID=2811411 RepID=UPI002725A08D|nr:hypothetical protein [Cypionkella sp.]MDO8985342.1 hypothetical protein [Cypionkella sp.]
MKPWIIIAAIGFAALAGMQGYRMGASANEARHIAALAEAQAEARTEARAATAEETKRLIAAAASAAEARALEDQAYAAPVENVVCLPVSRVLRLNKR